MRSEQIDFFMSCAACLNFSLAAKYHFVSVSTLSRSINSLEEELGFKLFNRGYHGHELTEAGKGFFEACAASRLEYEYFLLKWTKRSSEGVKIGCKPYDGAYECIIKLLYEISSENPSVKIGMQIIPESKMLSSLEDGILDYVVIEQNAEMDCEYVYPFLRAGEREFVLCSKHPIDDDMFSKISMFIR